MDKGMDSKQPNRRKFLKRAAVAGLAAEAVRSAKGQTPASPWREKGTSKELIAYGERSRFVTSLRAPVAERPSPDMFGLMFHVLTPLQDSVGSITPSSLHYVATHRGSYIPEIDPKQHRLMIHGMVDRPLIFTMDDLKRLPYVTRVHFIECIGNRAKPTHKTVQETHGMTSCSEWTGVLLSTLLKECGVQNGASWIVAEGAEEIKGASSIPLGKAMDDCLVAWGMNGEPIRPQQGFPLRLLVPGFEGIFQTKYLRRVKVVDRYYMTYNDYGHINPDPKATALGNQIGSDRNRSSRILPEDSNSPARAFTKSAAWRGPVGAPSAAWKYPPMAARAGKRPSCGRRRSLWRIRASVSIGIGTGKSV